MNVNTKKHVVNVYLNNSASDVRVSKRKNVKIVRAYRQSAIQMVSFILPIHNEYSLLTCKTACYARKLLSVQPDFISQRCEIEEKIEGLSANHYCVLYYPKFHCELNHIEYFWCHSKRYARESCDYTIDGLRQHVPDALARVRNSTILGCSFKSCMKKIE